LLALAFAPTRSCRVCAALTRSRAGALVPLLLLALLACGLRLRFGGLGTSMEAHSVVRELATEPWEVLAVHPAGAVVPGTLCPAAEYRVDGAARPALLLPPPARVRRPGGGSDERLWLV